MQYSIGDRIKAARQLGGIRNVEALAAKIGPDAKRGLATTTLRKIERGEVPVDYRDMLVIADACSVPIEFFTADFSRLSEISEDPRQVIARETAAAVERARERRARPPGDSPPQSEADQ